MAPPCSSFTLRTVDGAYDRLLGEGSRERPHALAKPEAYSIAQLNGSNPEFSVPLNHVVHPTDKRTLRFLTGLLSAVPIRYLGGRQARDESQMTRILCVGESPPMTTRHHVLQSLRSVTISPSPSQFTQHNSSR